MALNEAEIDADSETLDEFMDHIRKGWVRASEKASSQENSAAIMVTAAGVFLEKMLVHAARNNTPCEAALFTALQPIYEKDPMLVVNAVARLIMQNGISLDEAIQRTRPN